MFTGNRIHSRRVCFDGYHTLRQRIIQCSLSPRDQVLGAGAEGVCVPWEEKLRELPPISGDPALFRRIWDDLEGQAYTYIWHLLLSF